MSMPLNLDLFAVGIATAAIGILGFVVFFSNRRSVTNRTFLLFSLATILYGISNYLVYQSSAPEPVLWFLRLAVFFVVWHAFGIFQVFYVFPKEKFTFPGWYAWGLVPVVIITAFLTLTPLVFREVTAFSPEGRVATVANGPAIALFGTLVVGLIVSGIFVLLKKTYRADGVEKTQFRLVLMGSLMTFPLYIIFNFALPVFFDNSRFIPLAPVFSFPFVFFTAYAIGKYRLLNVRIITTEILTFVLAVVMLLEVILAQEPTVLLFRVGVFALVLAFGILLIRSVRREVEQREKLEVLSKELAAANEGLKKLDQAKSEFISIAGHQLRAPLTVIKGYVSMYLEGSLGPVVDKAKNAFGKVSISTEQIIKLIADLLNLSRIEAGKIQYEFVDDGLMNIVNEIIGEFNPKAKEKRLALVFDNHFKKEPFLRLDRDKMREVVVNLVDNAIKYSANGEVIVKAEPVRTHGHDAIRVSVKDTGIGIKKKDLERLFIKFVRTEEARIADANGLGLGLYFVKRVVEDHGGKVWAESDGVGEGSTFVVELPVAR